MDNTVTRATDKITDSASKAIDAIAQEDKTPSIHPAVGVIGVGAIGATFGAIAAGPLGAIVGATLGVAMASGENRLPA